MSYEIVNSIKGSSIVRADGAGTYTINVSALSANTSQETVTAAQIRKIVWSTSGSITIARLGGDNMLTLSGSGQMALPELGFSLANNATANIVVTITTGGSCIFEATKTATYSPALTS